jgi:hypothetical protein
VAEEQRWDDGGCLERTAAKEAVVKEELLFEERWQRPATNV